MKCISLYIVVAIMFIVTGCNLTQSAHDMTDHSLGEVFTVDGFDYCYGFWHGQKHLFQVSDDCYLIGGDIMLHSEDIDFTGHEISRGTFVNYTLLWPGGMIPYTIDSRFTESQVEEVKIALNHWNENTTIKFIELETDLPSLYISFTSGDLLGTGCYYADLGYNKNSGSKQEILLQPTDHFIVGSIIHELGHIVGMSHEHTRPDRDLYVNVYKDNWLSTAADFNTNMDKIKGPVIGEFDFNSIMMYGSYFGNGDLPNNDLRYATMTKKLPDGREGKISHQNTGLSAGDIEDVKAMYAGNTEPCNITPTTFNYTASGPEMYLSVSHFSGTLEDIQFTSYDYNFDGISDIVVFLTSGTTSGKIELVVYDGNVSGVYTELARYPIPITLDIHDVLDFKYVPTDWDNDNCMDIVALGTRTSNKMTYFVFSGDSGSQPYSLCIDYNQMDIKKVTDKEIQTSVAAYCLPESHPFYDGYQKINEMVLFYDNKPPSPTFSTTRHYFRRIPFFQRESPGTETQLNRCRNINSSTELLYQIGFYNGDYYPDLFLMDDDTTGLNSEEFYLKIYKGVESYRVDNSLHLSIGTNPTPETHILSWTQGRPDAFLMVPRNLRGGIMYTPVLIKWLYGGVFLVTFRM